MSADKQKNLAQGTPSLFKFSDSQFPAASREQTDKFSDRLAQSLAEGTSLKGMTLDMVIPALVLKVEEAVPPVDFAAAKSPKSEASPTEAKVI